MTCVYHTTERPSRTAKRARELWDRVNAEDGAPPKWLGLYIGEGGFRDWAWERTNGELDEMGGGLVGVPHIRRVREEG